MKQLMERIPLSRTEIYRRIRGNNFPRPIRLGKNRIAFIETEIEAWISDRLGTSSEQSDVR
ncbi:AlpA family phage regulatory protein [Mesorhizobium sp.]|uniref:helix-turn-helix transcriptional regulator n=1 Tax=Mesorhizobium sp. TaxID=1871066 RepID=UPI00344B3D3F